MNPSGRICVLSVLVGLALPVSAETYRWVDPASGRIILSNQPPPAGIKARQTRRTPGSAGENELPAALREPVARFPVTLYIAPACAELCGPAAQLLGARGIPYTLQTVVTAEQIKAMKQATGDLTVPTLMVGRQATRGFEAGAWNTLLDLAGYPQQPPAGYQPPPPTPVPPAAPAAEETAPAQ